MKYVTLIKAFFLGLKLWRAYKGKTCGNCKHYDHSMGMCTGHPHHSTKPINHFCGEWA
jgi:hypothetical protein